MQEKTQPIGYWLKKADMLLTQGINRIQSQFTITRKEWQILNLIGENGTIGDKELIDMMHPFAEEKQVIDILKTFGDKGLISREPICFLTNAGQQLYAECLKKENEFRQIAMMGLTEEEYEITLKALSKIIDNLEAHG